MIKTILIVLFFSISASSQDIDLPNKIPGVNYNSSISLPQEILGHKIGLRHTRTDQVLDYLLERMGSVDEH